MKPTGSKEHIINIYIQNPRKSLFHISKSEYARDRIHKYSSTSLFHRESLCRQEGPPTLNDLTPQPRANAASKLHCYTDFLSSRSLICLIIKSSSMQWHGKAVDMKSNHVHVSLCRLKSRLAKDFGWMAGHGGPVCRVLACNATRSHGQIVRVRKLGRID